MTSRAARDPSPVAIAACGKGRFGVQVARRGGWILLAALGVVGIAALALAS